MPRLSKTLLLMTTGLFVMPLASCSEKKTAEPEIEPVGKTKMMASDVATSRTSIVEPGVAGGLIEETFTATVTVNSVDLATRKVTLATENGNSATFTAGPEVKNLAQLHVGDKLNATLIQQLIVYVRRDGDQPSGAYAAAIASAPKGAKPGAVVAEAYEVIAVVTAIDPESRLATLKFLDKTRTVKVRPDVDMARYKVGDTVVIRVNTMLSVLTAS